MFLPIGDSPNQPQTPWLTWLLIVVNVAVHLALWPQGHVAPRRDDPVLHEYLAVMAAERGALPRRVSEGDLVRYEHGWKPGDMALRDAFTSMFLHGGFLHLAGNMLFLWIFGDNVEHRLGRLGFLAAYLATGLAAAGGDAVLRGGSLVPSVGASGAISGVLGLYFVWFPHNRVRVWVFLFPFLMEVLELSARFVLAVYLVLDNLLPLLVSGGEGGIAYGAHVGGFVGGWILARGLGGAPRRHRVGRHHHAGASPTPVAEGFREALAAGRLDLAAAFLFDRPRAESRRALTLADKVALGEALFHAAEPRAALAAFQRALADHPTAPGRARAHLGAARVLLDAYASPTAAYQHLYDAMDEDPTPDDVAEARALAEELRRATRLPRASRW